MRKTAPVCAAEAWPFNRANVRQRYTNVFRPASVASLWGCEGSAATVRKYSWKLCCCAKGADSHNRRWAMHILGSVYPYFPTPAHTEHIMLCLPIGLVFLLILLHPKHFWFPGLPERTELANESSWEQAKARRAAGMGRDVSPLFGVQGLACGHHLEHLEVSMCTPLKRSFSSPVN